MLYVVLVSTRNPLNIGAAARAMSNFGFLRLRVVNPYDVAFREAKSAVGASSLMADAEEFSSLADAVANCHLVVGTTAASNREVLHPLHSLPKAAEIIRPRMNSENVALLFGSEKRGLSVDDLNYCHFLLRIPTRPEHASMNLGQSVAVCLYELARTHSTPANPKVKHANSAEMERITELLLHSLNLSGYTKPRTAKPTEEKVRRLVRRLDPSSEDSELLLGMLRKIVRALGTGNKQP